MLRPLELSDLPTILPWFSLAEPHSCLPDYLGIDQAEFNDWFKRMEANPNEQWFFRLNEAGSPAGAIALSRANLKHGYAFLHLVTTAKATSGDNFRLIHEALILAFEELKLNKLNVELPATNSRAIEMVREAGFIEEGHLRQQHFDGEGYIDVLRLGMISPDWPQCLESMNSTIARLDALRAQKLASDLKCSILVLSDTSSWINPAIHRLVRDWTELGHTVHWQHTAQDLPSAELCFCLSFGQLLPGAALEQFKHTLVVHESDLPKGKGWSPLTWQIIEGKNRIPVVLFEAADRVDSGQIYAQRWIEFDGVELITELRDEQAKTTLELCRWFVDNYPHSILEARKQSGEETFYSRRGPKDSQLDPNSTIAEQFDLLRVVDNDRYPAFFDWNGKRFILQITEAKIEK